MRRSETRTFTLSAALIQSFSFQSDQRGGKSSRLSSASRPLGCRSRNMPSSLIMKKLVAWQSSALLAVFATILRNGVPSSWPPFGLTRGPSWVVRPVAPVQTISTASSSCESGCGLLVLWWLSGPASMEVPRAMRRVRRSTRQDMNG